MDFFYKQDLLAKHIFLIFSVSLGNIHSFKPLLKKTGLKKLNQNKTIDMTSRIFIKEHAARKVLFIISYQIN